MNDEGMRLTDFDLELLADGLKGLHELFVFKRELLLVHFEL